MFGVNLTWRKLREGSFQAWSWMPELRWRWGVRMRSPVWPGAVAGCLCCLCMRTTISGSNAPVLAQTTYQYRRLPRPSTSTTFRRRNSSSVGDGRLQQSLAIGSIGAYHCSSHLFSDVHHHLLYQSVEHVWFKFRSIEITFIDVINIWICLRRVYEGHPWPLGQWSCLQLSEKLNVWYVSASYIHTRVIIMVAIRRRLIEKLHGIAPSWCASGKNLRLSHDCSRVFTDGLCLGPSFLVRVDKNGELAKKHHKLLACERMHKIAILTLIWK